MNLYAYCLSDEVTAGAVGAESGLAGATPRLVRRGELAAVVSDFAGERPSVTRENVLAHERVVRHVLVETTPLPFRFGTIVSQARLDSYLDAQQAQLLAQLARVRGAVEMSVKVIWNPESVAREAAPAEPGEAGAGEGMAPPEAGSGTAFLLTKRRELLLESLLKERAEELAAWLAASLGDAVRGSQVSLQPGAGLVLSAAHLVERTRLGEYRAALRRAQTERPELHFLTSGAWPPYSFTSVGP